MLENEEDASLEGPVEEDEERHLGAEEALSDSQEPEEAIAGAEEQLEQLDVEVHPVQDDTLSSLPPAEHPPSQAQSGPIFDDPSDSDDGEGEWITPSNVGLHKSRALDLLPGSGIAKGKRKSDDEVLDTGCMTADFAMQNVLLQMRLSLVGVEGKRIEKVKSWVMRCHACFKSVFVFQDFVFQELMNILIFG